MSSACKFSLLRPTNKGLSPAVMLARIIDVPEKLPIYRGESL
jgi:hypothetical protein